MAIMALRAWKPVKESRIVQLDAGIPNSAHRIQTLSHPLAILTFPAVKVNMGRKIMASLPSGTLVQTAANTVIMAPDCEGTHREK